MLELLRPLILVTSQKVVYAGDESMKTNGSFLRIRVIQKTIQERNDHMDTLTDFRLDGEQTLDLNAIARNLLESLLNEVMSEQATELCSEYGTLRNGYRERKLATCIGTITLKIPKLREGSYFPDDIVTRWSRTDTALASTICEMWVNGISNRKVEAVVEKLGIEKMSRSKVSRLCKALDEQISEMHTCSLSDKAWPYLWLDATYVKCREAGAARSTAVVVAVAADERAKRRVVGLRCIDSESYISWRDFLLDLRKRGMSGVQLVISDDHAGLVRAVREVMIGAGWQRCIAHLERNVIDRVKRRGTGAAAVAALKAAFAETKPALVRAGYNKACNLLREHDEAGASLLEDAREDALAYLAFPQEHRHWIRTNNICERINAELKRRTRVVQVFPSNESLIRLIGAVCCEQNDTWEVERYFIDAKTMTSLCPEEHKEEPDSTELARVIQLVEEAFERKLKVA